MEEKKITADLSANWRSSQREDAEDAEEEQRTQRKNKEVEEYYTERHNLSRSIGRVTQRKKKFSVQRLAFSPQPGFLPSTSYEHPATSIQQPASSIQQPASSNQQPAKNCRMT